MPARAFAYTTSQAAAYLGITQNTLRRWTDEGEVEFTRTPGNQRRYSKADLDAFVAKHRGAARTEA